MLGQDMVTQRAVVVKDYIHESEEWRLNKAIVRQFEIYAKTHGQKNMQECLDVQILSSRTRFVFRYYPLSFDNLMQRTVPCGFLWNKTIELVKAVLQLHSLGIAHRDIKAYNICFDKRCGLVLIDFDSAILQQQQAEEEKADMMLETTTQNKTLPVCTLSTCAPEQFVAALQEPSGEYNAFAGDWWAVGCVIAQMFTQTELFAFTGTPALPAKLVEEHLKAMKTFSEAFCNDLYTTQHPQVKLLRRTIAHQTIIVLLQSLLSFDTDKRFAAVANFLENSIAL
jgi:serine/threonine protein kinase